MVPSQRKSVQNRQHSKPRQNLSRQNIQEEFSASLLDKFELKELYLDYREIEELGDFMTTALKRKRRLNRQSNQQSGVTNLKLVSLIPSEVTVSKIKKIRPMEGIKKKIRRTSREKKKKQMNQTGYFQGKRKLDKESARSNEKSFKVDLTALEKIYMTSTVNNFYQSRVSLKQIHQEPSKKSNMFKTRTSAVSSNRSLLKRASIGNPNNSQDIDLGSHTDLSSPFRSKSKVKFKKTSTLRTNSLRSSQQEVLTRNKTEKFKKDQNQDGRKQRISFIEEKEDSFHTEQEETLDQIKGGIGAEKSKQSMNQSFHSLQKKVKLQNPHLQKSTFKAKQSNQYLEPKTQQQSLRSLPKKRIIKQKTPLKDRSTERQVALNDRLKQKRVMIARSHNVSPSQHENPSAQSMNLPLPHLSNRAAIRKQVKKRKQGIALEFVINRQPQYGQNINQIKLKAQQLLDQCQSLKREQKKPWLEPMQQTYLSNFRLKKSPGPLQKKEHNKIYYSHMLSSPDESAQHRDYLSNISSKELTLKGKNETQNLIQNSSKNTSPVISIQTQNRFFDSNYQQRQNGAGGFQSVKKKLKMNQTGSNFHKPLNSGTNQFAASQISLRNSQEIKPYEQKPKRIPQNQVVLPPVIPFS